MSERYYANSNTRYCDRAEEIPLNTEYSAEYWVKEYVSGRIEKPVEFINKETRLNLNDYLNRYEKYTKKIFLTNNEKVYEEFGENSSGEKQIALSNKRIKEATDSGFLYRCFSHESNHAFCNEYLKGHNVRRAISYQQIH